MSKKVVISKEKWRRMLRFMKKSGAEKWLKEKRKLFDIEVEGE